MQKLMQTLDDNSSSICTFMQDSTNKLFDGPHKPGDGPHKPLAFYQVLVHLFLLFVLNLKNKILFKPNKLFLLKNAISFYNAIIQNS